MPCQSEGRNYKGTVPSPQTKARFVAFSDSRSSWNGKAAGRSETQSEHPPYSERFSPIASAVMNTTSSPAAAGSGTAFGVLGAISFSHFLNDTIQSLILAIYPLFKTEFGLNFAQIGLITLVFQCTASLLQPVVGYYTDRRPKPFSLALGMGCTLAGLLTLSLAHQFPVVLLAAALIGSGSAVFHPESARVARMASGGRHGLAQSIFQVGGNAGSATGPLLAAWIVHQQSGVAWFSLAALLAIAVLWMGVYPKPFTDVMDASVANLVKQVAISKLN